MRCSEGVWVCCVLVSASNRHPFSPINGIYPRLQIVFNPVGSKRRIPSDILPIDIVSCEARSVAPVTQCAANSSAVGERWWLGGGPR